MTNLLFPARHLLHTSFQARTLQGVLQMPLSALTFYEDDRPPMDEPIDHVVFAVTSSNQQHSRYNPLPFYVRAIGVDRFARAMEQAIPFSYRLIGIPHYAPTPRFAEFVLKEIAEQTEGRLRLTPQNSIILSATPDLITLFRKLGFALLTPEREGPAPRPETPTRLLRKIVAAGEGWAQQRELREKMAQTTFDLWSDFPDVPRRVLRLWRDPLLNEGGSLTETRDYDVYAVGMGNREIIEVKYADIKQAIVPGKIVDEGCADGALLARIAPDFPDSDLIGIEITGEFLARAEERQRAGQFGGTFVHFHQRNITRPIFEDSSIDTTICNSTIHELWSYGEGERTVAAYLRLKFDQTRPGGRLIIRDVVGPAQMDEEVLLRLEHRDGVNEGIFASFDDPHALGQHLRTLSTYALFKRFARDFLPDSARAEGATAFAYRESVIAGDRCAVLALRYAAEFMSKKDYVENWQSEMRETFAFWDFAAWKAALVTAGFRVLENPNEPELGSRVYSSAWIREKRWDGKVALYRRHGGRLEPLPYPPTNIVLVGEKAP